MTLQELQNLIKFAVDEKSVSDVQNTMNSLKSTAKKILGAVGITLTLNGVKQFAQECVQVASDVQEMEGKAAVVFGKFADDADAWAESYSDSIGRSKSEIKTYITDMQNLLTGFTDGSEEAREACMELSEAATSLAIDNASFDNTDEAVSIQRMTKAIMGQTEAARMMGAILDDNTRAEAMLRMGLSGTYKELDQYTKMTVNLNALQYQMKDAIGDAANSTARYEGRARQLASAQKELKEIIGTGILPLMTLWNRVQTVITDGEIKLAKAVFDDTNGESRLQQVTNWLSTALDRLSMMLGKAKDGFAKIADRLGGVENTIKIITILIGALALVMNFEAGVKAVQKVVDVFGKLNKVLGGSKRVMLLVAAIALLAIVVEDFVNFMQGNDSLIGELFKKAGIDADEMRGKITSTLEDIKKVVGDVIEGLQGWFEVGFEIIKGFSEAFDIDIGDSFGEAIATVVGLVSKLFDMLAKNPGAAKELGKGIGEFVTCLVAAKAALAGLNSISKVVGVLSKVNGSVGSLMIWFMTLPAPVKIAIAVIAAVAAAALLIYKNWDKIKPVIDTVIQALKNFFATASEVCRGVQDYFANLGKSLAHKCGDIHDTIVDALKAAIDWITSLPSQAFQWGADIINGIVNGIKSVANTVGDAVKGVADKIKSFLGFSEPEEGPLSDFHTYMPDMISLMAKGISDGKSKIRDALKGVAGEMSLTANVGTHIDEHKNGFGAFMNGVSALVGVKTPAPATVSTATSSSVSSRNVTQNVTISNRFEGDKAVQKNASKAMDKSAKDATSQMARALAYAR